MEKFIESLRDKVLVVVWIAIILALIAFAFPETREGFKALGYILWELLKLKKK